MFHLDARLAACAALLAANIFGWNLSTLVLLISAGVIGFASYKVKGGAAQ